MKISVIGSNKAAQVKYDAIAAFVEADITCYDICLMAEANKRGAIKFDSHFYLKQSDLVYLAVVDNYAGTATAVNLGIAVGSGIPVIASDKIENDPDFGDFIFSYLRPQELIEKYSKQKVVFALTEYLAQNSLELAREGYRAYSRSTNNLNYQGDSMSEFTNLPDNIIKAWQSASLEVAENVLNLIKSAKNA